MNHLKAHSGIPDGLEPITSLCFLEAKEKNLYELFLSGNLTVCLDTCKCEDFNLFFLQEATFNNPLQVFLHKNISAIIILLLLEKFSKR